MSREKEELGNKLRKLSSPLTWWIQFAFPVFAIGLSGLITLVVFLEPSLSDSDQPDFVKWVVPPFMLVFSCIFYWSVRHLKTVYLTPTSFRISHSRTEIEVPFSDVERVSSFRSGKTHYIVLHLRVPTRFGTEMTFLPMPERPYVRIELPSRGRPHPMVQELQGLLPSQDKKSRRRNNSP